MRLSMSCRRVSGAAIMLVAVALIVPSPAFAVDTEPLNNSQSTADPLSLGRTGSAISNLAELGAPGGDIDFYQAPLNAGEVLFGMVTPIAGPSTRPFRSPETIVSVFDHGEQRTFGVYDGAGELPGNREDPFETYGSVFRFAATAAGDYQIGVTGCCDVEVDGDEGGENIEVGGYVLTAGRIDPNQSGGDFSDREPANQSASGADLIPLSTGTARVAVGELSRNDVDFYHLGLHAGDILSVLTAPLSALPNSFSAPWTRVGLFDSSGTNLLVDNYTAGGGFVFIGGLFPSPEDLSSNSPSDLDGSFGSGGGLRVSISADGDYFLAVTGIEDESFAGSHSELGKYALLVGLAPVPEPSAATLGVVACVACVIRWRRSASRDIDLHQENQS